MSAATENAVFRVAGRVRLAIGRAVLGLVNDAAKLQAVQVMVRSGEVRDRAEHFQHYGFTSVPLPGAEGIGLAVGGSTDHMVVINIDDRRYRKTGLQPGEVRVYDRWGNYALFKDGEMVVRHTTKVSIDAPLVHMTGNLAIDGSLAVVGAATMAGSLVVAGDVTAAGTSVHTHVHGGVSSGASNTGAPV